MLVWQKIKCIKMNISLPMLVKAASVLPFSVFNEFQPLSDETILRATQLNIIEASLFDAYEGNYMNSAFGGLLSYCAPDMVEDNDKALIWILGYIAWNAQFCKNIGVDPWVHNIIPLLHSAISKNRFRTFALKRALCITMYILTYKKKTASTSK
jgi:hypothetical protein